MRILRRELPSFAATVASYDLPADPRQRRRTPARLPPWRMREGRRRVELARERGEPRLAWLDSTFPWRRSGFRYDEALELHRLRPDTLFFSEWRMSGEFPAPVHRLHEFPRIAAAEGITDAYGVFESFLAGVAGVPLPPPLRWHPMVGSDLSRALGGLAIRLHGTIYPGGGFVPTAAGLEQTRRLAARLHTTFSYVPEVLAHVPGVHEIPQALTAVSFYRPTAERWDAVRPLRCLFVADAPARKGFDVVAGAFRDLPPERFQLDVVGPYLRRRDEIPAAVARFHGWADPEALRDLHTRAHVILSPVSVAEDGVVDGFPTQAASDAMSSGCMLLGSNPISDRRVLEPGRDYVLCAPEPGAVRAELLRLAGRPEEMRAVAEAGSAQVHRRMDIADTARLKLEAMGLR